MTIGLANYLTRYPRIHKKYIHFTLMYEGYTRCLPYKLFYLKARLKKKKTKTILTYPQRTYGCHTLDQIACYNGYKVTTKPQLADFVVYFHDTTYRTPDKFLQKLNKKIKVINFNSRDISKEKVSAVQKKVFGYGSEINPLTYKGKYVKKGNINSLHNGKIMDKPEKPEKGYIYQPLINNEYNGELIELRVPIFKDTIPFVYIKHRSTTINRFSSFNKSVEIVEPHKVFSAQEYKKLLIFCKEMGIDYAEMDIMRDKDSKRLYILDVNNTPGGPPHQINENLEKAVKMLSDAFHKAFLE